MIPVELLNVIIQGAFALGTAKVEWSKVEEKTRGVPAEKIPAVLDALFAEASQNLDGAIAKAPDAPAG